MFITHLLNGVHPSYGEVLDLIDVAVERFERLGLKALKRALLWIWKLNCESTLPRYQPFVTPSLAPSEMRRRILASCASVLHPIAERTAPKPRLIWCQAQPERRYKEVTTKWTESQKLAPSRDGPKLQKDL
jgi:hypothetical protein